MSLLNSIIEFTSIALKCGLPLDIIKYIIDKNNNLTQCDLCSDYFSCMWYSRSCVNCLKSSINCCHLCWRNDILNYKGRYCVKCKRWYCGKCVDHIYVVDTSRGWDCVPCVCGYKQVTTTNFSEKYDEWVVRTI